MEVVAIKISMTEYHLINHYTLLFLYTLILTQQSMGEMEYGKSGTFLHECVGGKNAY